MRHPAGAVALALRARLAVDVVAEAVGLDEVAAADVALRREGLVLLGDVDAVLAHVNLVAHLIVAAILPVEGQVDEHGAGGERLAAEVADVAGQGVAQERLVAVVGQQGPLLGIGALRAHEALLLRELDAVGLLLHFPGRVAASTDEDRVVVGLAAALDDPQSCRHLGGLAGGVLSAEGLDVDVGQVGQLSAAAVLCHDDNGGSDEGNQCERKAFHVRAVMKSDVFSVCKFIK